MTCRSFVAPPPPPAAVTPPPPPAAVAPPPPPLPVAVTPQREISMAFYFFDRESFFFGMRDDAISIRTAYAASVGFLSL